MRIALVAPIDETVPPARYGGIELVVHYLAQELVARGHEVVLLASADSTNGVRVVGTVPAALRACGMDGSAAAATVKAHARSAILDAVEAEQPDVVHNHFRHLLDAQPAWATRMVTTMHYPLDNGRQRHSFLRNTSHRYVAVSADQCRSAAGLEVLDTIHHGVRVRDYPLGSGDGGYLAFLGRIAPEKGIEHAVAVATRCGYPLRVAAKVERRHASYFSHVVAPLFARHGVDYLGELDQPGKRTFLGDAVGLLFPSVWREPFGLAAIEAMACGTPVVALSSGSLPELIDDGVTGFTVSTPAGMVAAVGRLGEVSRSRCRATAAARFDASVMATRYEDVFVRVLAGSPT
jgi:glycosyltransferase involved in cell wall biosynthesis